MLGEEASPPPGVVSNSFHAKGHATFKKFRAGLLAEIIDCEGTKSPMGRPVFAGDFFAWLSSGVTR